MAPNHALQLTWQPGAAWHLENLRQQTQATVAKLRLLYPEVPVGGSEGARDEESTYLHLVVNYLEPQVMRQLLGDERAEEVFDFWTGDHYTWIYATVLEDEGRIGAIIDTHGLSI